MAYHEIPNSAWRAQGGGEPSSTLLCLSCSSYGDRACKIFFYPMLGLGDHCPFGTLSLGNRCRLLLSNATVNVRETLAEHGLKVPRMQYS